ncbi:MAG: transporter substrate-binding domain-containing protein [Pontibacterium sp.]
MVSHTTKAEVSLIPESANWEDTSRVIRIGGDYNFPPYEFADKNGKPSGYNVEMSQAIADIMGIKVEIVLGDWDDMRQALNSGDIDILQGMTITAERQKTISFAPSNVLIQQSIFARKGTHAVSSLDQLRGKQVIVQSQGSMHDYLSENDFDAEIIPVTTHVDALRLLSSGKHDYAIVANLPGLYYAKELGLTNLTIVGKPFRAGGYTYATLKGNEPLLAEFTEGLAILKNTGRQQEIYTKWLGILEEQESTPWRYIGLGAVALSIISILITAVVSFWNRALRSQVEKRTAELHEHQKQLIQADKMSSLGVLVSGVAHEVNNPTSLLLLNLPLLRDAWNDAQPILDSYHNEHHNFTLAGLPYSRLKYELPLVIDEMSGGAERIKRIVEDLKDFARYDPEQHKKLIQINRVVQAAIRLVENSIRKSTDNFTVRYHDATPLVYGDAQRIEQVVVNLLLNACQSLSDASCSISVQVSHDEKEDQVLISLIDEGVGIKDEDISRLTDPFFTTKREQGGTGLGLSVSASIVQSHGGSLEFRSTQDKGTCVILALPVPRDSKNV